MDEFDGLMNGPAQSPEASPSKAAPPGKAGGKGKWGSGGTGGDDSPPPSFKGCGRGAAPKTDPKRKSKLCLSYTVKLPSHFGTYLSWFLF